MKILLFQARDEGDPMRAHEERCFLDKLARFEGRSELQLTTFNLVTEPPDSQGLWRDHDVVLVGGSGKYGCVGNDHAWYLQFLETLRRLVEERPMFCSCFGHQALAVALGGRVIVDRLNAELGTHLIELDEQGLQDPLFDGLGPSFFAQLGHNDRVVELPAGAENLAFTAACPIQSYRLSGRLVYATQFHPELDHLQNQERAMGYLQVYDVEKTRPERLAEMFRPSDQASELLSRFLQLVVRSRESRAHEASSPARPTLF